MFALIQKKRQIRESLKKRSHQQEGKTPPKERLSSITEEIIAKKQEETQRQETPEGKHDGERLSSITEEMILKKQEELRSKKERSD